jgi:serine/threonine protein kinase
LASGRVVAIKLVKNIFKSFYETKKLLREITILRALSAMDHNVFTSKLIDIVLPERTSDFEEYSETPDLRVFDHMFLVLEYVKCDLLQVFNLKTPLKESHIIRITYNILCALNFVHSAGIMHRDLKPSNILIDTSCKVQICDFGLARVVPT